MKDLYALQMRRALKRVISDAAIDTDSKLLLETLSLEVGRQQRLVRVQEKRAGLELPDTLQGRTEALEKLIDG
ncbi:MAG: hypothetical protein AAFV85_23225 [Cyanobacteria bacterium J06634_6]